MYEVNMKYMNIENQETTNFRCEKFNIEDNIYKFENIHMNDFIINDMEICNEDIASIIIK